jgi:hypothetical protein
MLYELVPAQDRSADVVGGTTRWVSSVICSTSIRDPGHVKISPRVGFESSSYDEPATDTPARGVGLDMTDWFVLANR